MQSEGARAGQEGCSAEAAPRLQLQGFFCRLLKLKEQVTRSAFLNCKRIWNCRLDIRKQREQRQPEMFQ